MLELRVDVGHYMSGILFGTHEELCVSSFPVSRPAVKEAGGGVRVWDPKR